MNYNHRTKKKQARTLKQRTRRWNKMFIRSYRINKDSNLSLDNVIGKGDSK